MPNTVYALAVATILLGIPHILRRTIFDPLKDIPLAPQEPFHKRLLLEPGPQQTKVWAREIPNTGLIRYYGRLNQPRVLLTSPQAIQDVMITQPYVFRRPAFVAKVLRSILGEGVFVAEGDTHKTQSRKANELVEILGMARTAESSTSASASLDITDYMRRSTLDIIGLAGFGLDFNSLKNPATELLKTYVHVFDPDEATLRYRIISLLLPDWVSQHLPLKHKQDLAAAIGIVKDYIKAAIDEQMNGAGSDAKSHDHATNEKGGDDVIGVLMSESGVRDSRVLIDQSMNMLGAGHDTVYSAMICAIFELSKRPEMQDRLRCEVRGYLNALEASGDAQGSDIDGLPYLAAFCNEVYRYWPAVPFARRESIVPVKVADHAIPTGTVMIYSSRVFHRSPELWQSDPQKFDPERWMQDPMLGGATEKKAFGSFGHGPRACIGERFTRAEVKHLLAMLMGRFQVRFEGTGPQHD